ncbi:helix-turn-helix domain-containing protein [Solibaculum mannosilyticum]|uniref:helix-turn-helix domain-containing protein n=1 Tax=Solibaculum mannosilyticum TaxID=2780922 RepID=UPI0007A923FB|nr:Regulatory protein SoxS [Eubacteriaceae bacterium CHKCI005]
MFETILEQIADQNSSPETIHWVTSMTGVRVCDFACHSPLDSIPLILSAHHFEVLFCLQGSIRIEQTDGRSLTLQESEILLLFDLSQIQTVHWSDDFAQGVLVSIDTSKSYESLFQLCSLMGGLDFDPVQVEDVMRRHKGCAIISQNGWIDTVFHTAKQLSPDQRGRYCTFMTIELLYYLSHENDYFTYKSPFSYFDLHQVKTAQQVQDYILSHLDESLTIDRLSRMFHISSTLLKSCFRQLYGQPLHKYIQENRIRQAAKLLLSTNQPILQISAAVGYESASQFGALFKRYYQTTPSQYRKEAKKMSKSV